MSPDGSKAVRVTSNLQSEQNPGWSPDGQHIAFERGCEIYVMNIDSSNQRSLVKRPTCSRSPVWSPNGKEIAFVSLLETSGPQAIFVVDTATGNVEQLTLGSTYVGDPDWSPDGTRIIFASANSDLDINIFVMERDGSNLRQLTTDTYDDTQPSWNRDGSRIAFLSGRAGGTWQSEAGIHERYEIYVMDSEGNNVRRVTYSFYSITSIDW
jgi:TolB protein